MEPLLAQHPHPRSRAFALAGPRPGSRAGKDSGRATWTTLVVLAGVALALRAGDALPGWISSVPRGVHLCTSVEEAQARTGLDLGKVRDSLGDYAFTTSGIRTTARPIPAVAIVMQGGEGKSQLTLFRSRGGAIPTTLRQPLPSFHEIAIPLKPGLSASLSAERQHDGSVWQDVEWRDGTGNTALRFNGRTVELLRLAKQLVEAVP